MKKSRRHALGQHFLVQPGILDKIVRTIDPRPDELILEVGPGRGALTALLAGKAGKVVGVEKDDRLIPVLEARRLPRTTIVRADILDLDWRRLIEAEAASFRTAKLAGNIPYAISSPLLAKVHDSRSLFVRCVFLLQKEFAERLYARPGSKTFAPLSILTQRAFTVERCFPVAAGSFAPPPKVESEVISLTPRPEVIDSVDDEPSLAAFLRAGFGQRRKTLANNLERFGIARQSVRTAFESLGIPAKIRAEAVGGSEFVKLYRILRPAFPAKTKLKN